MKRGDNFDYMQQIINNTKLAEYLSSCQNAVNVHTECRRNFTKRNTRLESECSEHGADFVPKKLQFSTHHLIGGHAVSSVVNWLLLTIVIVKEVTFM